MIGGLSGILMGVILAFLYWIIIGAVAAATNGVYVTALYQFAVKKKLPSEFDQSTIPQPLSPLEPNKIF